MSLAVTDWRPSAGLEVLRARAGMLARVREFFSRRGVIEVDTPVLSHAAVSDTQLSSVPAELAGFGRMYLQTSPEYPMKRLLAAGIGDCYQVCHVFRDGESGRQHNPEFTMIEWYRIGFDTTALMTEVEALLCAMLAPHRTLTPFARISYQEAMQRGTGVDPLHASPADLAAALRRHGLELMPGPPLSRDAALELLMAAVVGPTLGHGSGLFIHDYPASQAALARLKPGDPTVAERFELYLDGIELANGFHELADPAEQRARFTADLEARAALGLSTPPLDRRLLAALEHGLPDCAGVALGFDRAVMAGLSLATLAEAMPFPAHLA